MPQEYGSLVNMMMGQGGQAKPEVGMGATRLGWTDRYPYTIIKVSASGKTIQVQEDDAIRTDGGGMTEAQTYEYKRNPEGHKVTVRLTTKGWKGADGSRWSIGERSCYHDFSF